MKIVFSLVTILHGLLPYIMWVAPQTVTVILGLVSAIGIYRGWSRIRTHPMIQKYGIYSCMLVGSSVILSMIFSMDKGLTFKACGKIIYLYACGIGLYSLYKTAEPQYYNRWMHTLMIHYGLSCLFYVMITQIDDNVLALKGCIQGSLFISLLFWGVVYAALQSQKYIQKPFMWIIMICGGGAIMLSPCDTTLMGVMLGLCVAGLFYCIRNRWIEYATQGIIIVSFILAPFVALTSFKPEQIPSYTFLKDNGHIHRLYVWHNTSQAILKRPLWGYGLGTSKRLGCQSEEDDACHFNMPYTTRQGEHIHIRAEKMGVHPHNMALQLWLELGVVGALGGGLMIAWIWRQIYRISGKAMRVCSMGLFTSSMMAFWVNLGMLQTWWWCVLIWCGYVLYSQNSQRDA